MRETTPQEPERPMVAMPYYIYGVSADLIDPPLPFLQLDDWWTPLNAWIAENYPDGTWHCVTGGAGDDAPMKSIWVGTPPPDDKLQSGDVVRVIRVGPKSA